MCSNLTGLIVYFVLTGHLAHGHHLIFVLDVVLLLLFRLRMVQLHTQKVNTGSNSSTHHGPYHWDPPPAAPRSVRITTTSAWIIQRHAINLNLHTTFILYRDTWRGFVAMEMPSQCIRDPAVCTRGVCHVFVLTYFNVQFIKSSNWTSCLIYYYLLICRFKKKKKKDLKTHLFSMAFKTGGMHRLLPQLLLRFDYVFVLFYDIVLICFTPLLIFMALFYNVWSLLILFVQHFGQLRF